MPSPTDSVVDISNLEKQGWISLKDLLYTNGSKTLDPRKTNSSEIMQVYFTSGTTGDPKMVPHTQGSYGYCHWVTGTSLLDG